MRWRRLSGLVVVLLLMVTVSIRAEVVDWIVAVVNGDVILNSELQDRLNEVTRDPAALRGKSLTEIRNDLLREMIYEKLAEQEVRRLHIEVSPSELDQTIEAIKRSQGLGDQDLHALLKKENLTMDQFRERVRKNIERARLIERVLKSKTVITDEDVNGYLRRHGYAGEEKRHLAVIFIPANPDDGWTGRQDARKRAEQIYEKLRKGEPFAELARKFSKGPGAQDGGDIGTLSTKDLAPVLEAATRGLKPGQFTEVVGTSSGFYILKVLDVQVQDSAVDSRVKERVRQELFQREVNKKYDKWIRDLERRSSIQIYPGPVLAGS